MKSRGNGCRGALPEERGTAALPPVGGDPNFSLGTEDESSGVTDR